MDIFTAIVTALVSISGTLGISKFLRTKEEKTEDGISNAQSTVDVIKSVLDEVREELDNAKNDLQNANKTIKEQQNRIISNMMENKELAIKITELELLYCSTKACTSRKNPYRNCVECPEADTCTLKDYRRPTCDLPKIPDEEETGDVIE